MKRAVITLSMIFCCIILKAQTSSTNGISDADLKKYAETMDSVKGMQQTLTDIITENVQKNTVMTVQRFNELYKMVSDSSKLVAANITPEEKDFLALIEDLRKYNIERINATYQALAKDYVGLKTFNQIRKGLEADQKLKERYDALVQEGSSSSTSEDAKGN